LIPGADLQESPVKQFTDFRGSPVVFVTYRVPTGFALLAPIEERCPELMLLCVGIADNCEPAASIVMHVEYES
jgi:hypothetical protein